MKGTLDGTVWGFRPAILRIVKLLRQCAAAGALDESDCWVDTLATLGSYIVVAVGSLPTKVGTLALVLVGKDNTVGNSSLESDAGMAATLTDSEPKVVNTSEDVVLGVVVAWVAEDWAPLGATIETGSPALATEVADGEPVVATFEAAEVEADSTPI